MQQKRVATTADRLKEALTLSGMKQSDLVGRTGIDKGSISNYLSGRYEPKARALRKLAIALNVSEMWLWGYDVSRERTSLKKNDRMVAIISKMRKDDNFLELAEMLCKLSPEQYESIKQLLAAFTNTRDLH